MHCPQSLILALPVLCVSNIRRAHIIAHVIHCTETKNINQTLATIRPNCLVTTCHQAGIQCHRHDMVAPLSSNDETSSILDRICNFLKRLTDPYSTAVNFSLDGKKWMPGVLTMTAECNDDQKVIGRFSNFDLHGH